MTTTPGADELHIRDLLINRGVHPAADGPAAVFPPMPDESPTVHEKAVQEEHDDATADGDQEQPELDDRRAKQERVRDEMREELTEERRARQNEDRDVLRDEPADLYRAATRPSRRPEPAPGRTVPLRGSPSRYPDWRTGPVDLAKLDQADEEETTPADVAPADEGEREEGAAPEADGDTSPDDLPKTQPTGRVRLIATTVQEWRPPVGPRGLGWIRAVIYTGSGIGVGWLTGCTRAVYTTLDQMSVNPDAVGGIAISAAMAALMISRSKKTWIGLGCALLLVLAIQYLTLPVFVGALATTVVWGLDQRARHMRHAIAWTIRAAFGSVLLATFALVWTTAVHYLTGAPQ